MPSHALAHVIVIEHITPEERAAFQVTPCRVVSQARRWAVFVSLRDPRDVTGSGQAR
jgi:hypothetical protein